ncbi:hypothetical protein YC2023_122325 [Brassica napus]
MSSQKRRASKDKSKEMVQTEEGAVNDGKGRSLLLGLGDLVSTAHLLSDGSPPDGSPPETSPPDSGSLDGSLDLSLGGSLDGSLDGSVDGSVDGSPLSSTSYSAIRRLIGELRFNYNNPVSISKQLEEKEPFRPKLKQKRMKIMVLHFLDGD